MSDLCSTKKDTTAINRVSAKSTTMSKTEDIPIEQHPLKPFLPVGAKLLMLGSFPPPQKRWSIDFFYPNLQNDMWRIFGIIFRNDKNAFIDTTCKKFKKQDLVKFLTKQGIAIYDTASAVKRLQGNASDKFLEIVTPTDIAQLLNKIPQCKAIVTTGQKATGILCDVLSTHAPKLGSGHQVHFQGREITFYRMPSSSRAYPLSLENKAETYKKMFEEIGLL